MIFYQLSGRRLRGYKRCHIKIEFDNYHCTRVRHASQVILFGENLIRQIDGVCLIYLMARDKCDERKKKDFYILTKIARFTHASEAPITVITIARSLV
jgi:hypothetical protein